MASYKKVFFYPWVGPDYEKGINFDHNGRLIFKEPDGWKTYEKDGKKTPVALIHPELPPLRLAVYGKEHYCKDRAHCEHRNFEQDFYLQVLTPATLGQLQNAANVEKYIDQLAQFHKDPFFTLAGIDWKDKFYVLHKDYNWPLCQIEKYFKLSSADLCLYMALEKILTFLSQWDKSSAQQANEVVKIVQNFQKFKNEAALHHFCPMHMEFTCPVCHEEKFTCTHCEHIPVCRYKTQRQLSNYSTEIVINGQTQFIQPESDSHRPFREALGNTPKIWKHLLFSNFYQRGTPYIDTEKNAELYTINDYENAKAAFLEVVKENQPDIIITWGKENKLPLLEVSGVRQMPKPNNANHEYQIPRIHIEKANESKKHRTKYTIPFTILECKGKPILILFLNHPGRGFSKEKNHNLICFAFKHYDELIKWDPDKNKNTLGLPYPITCEFDTKLDWLNPQAQADFQKCT